MFDREIETELVSLTKDYPVVTLTGPRQSGKTTLVRNTFKEKESLSLQQILVRIRT